MPGVSPLRLNLLRLIYLAMAFVLGSIVWPSLLDTAKTWQVAPSIVTSMLAALSVVSVLGLINPLKMLPAILFELFWKSIWLLCVALPAWLQGPLDAAMLRTFNQCIGVVILLPLIPWGYVWHTYVVDASEPWLQRKSEAATATRY